MVVNPNYKKFIKKLTLPHHAAPTPNDELEMRSFRNGTFVLKVSTISAPSGTYFDWLSEVLEQVRVDVRTGALPQPDQIIELQVR